MIYYKRYFFNFHFKKPISLCVYKKQKAPCQWSFSKGLFEIKLLIFPMIALLSENINNTIYIHAQIACLFT